MQQLQILPDYELAHARGKLPRPQYRVGDLVLCRDLSYAYVGTVESYGWEVVAGGTWPMYRVRIAPQCVTFRTPDRMLRRISSDDVDPTLIGVDACSHVLVNADHPTGLNMCHDHYWAAWQEVSARLGQGRGLEHVSGNTVLSSDDGLLCDLCRAEGQPS